MLPLSSKASDSHLQNESTVFDQTFSWEAMIGISAFHNPHIIEGADQVTVSDWLNVSLFFDLYYKGFFIQSNHMRADSLLYGAEFGYQLVVEPEWQLDVLVRSYLPAYELTYHIQDNTTSQQYTYLSETDEGQGLGLRFSRYFDQAVMSIDVAALEPVSESKGWVVDWYYNKLVHHRNWDIYIGGGLTYYSKATLNHYLSPKISPQYTDIEYHPDNSGLRAQVEILARYPINKKWLFNAGINQNYYNSGFTNSPLVEKNFITRVQLGVVYVF